MRVAALLGCGLFVVVIARESYAHRLDEYLQATRIAVTTNRIELTFELTPGAAVAKPVIELLDPDRDGRVAGDEGTAYAQRFLKDLHIGLDGKAVALSVTAATFPALHEIRSGTGVIRIRGTSMVGPLDAGSHSLTLTNRHLPAISVYLVNALQSRDPAVEIGRQTRDNLQTSYRLEFRVRPVRP